MEQEKNKILLTFDPVFLRNNLRGYQKKIKLIEEIA